jgi:hypothetical protein
MIQQSIFFCILPGNHLTCKCLERLASKLRESASVQVARDVDDARVKLLYRSEDINVAVVFAATRRDLSALRSIWELLQNTRTILILPDDEEETVAVAHSMRPRFIGYGNRELRGVAAVLEKMTGIRIENGGMQP